MLNQLKKTFNISGDSENESEQSLSRIYNIIGALLTLLYTTINFENLNYFDLACLSVFILLFFIGFGFSSRLYSIKIIRDNLSEITLWMYILISAYGLYATHQRSFSVDYSFGLAIMFFVFGMVLKEVRHILIYFSVTAVMGGISLVLADSTHVSVSFLSIFFLIFFCVGFFAMRYKSGIQNRLEQRENFLKTLFNQAYDSIFLVDFYSRVVVDCNQASVRMFEVMDKNEIIGQKRDLFEEYKMSDNELIKCRRELAQNGIWRNETSFITKKGKQFWGEIVITPLTIGSTQYYVARINDISHQRIAKEALRENEERYRNIFKKNPQPIWIYDPTTLKFIDVNDEAVRFYGFSHEEFMKKTILDVRSEPEKNRLLEYLKLNSPGDNEIKYTGDWKHIKKDGTEIEVEIVRTQITFHHKIANLAIIKDVTQIRKAEKALLESEERFKRLSETTSESIAIHQNGKILEVNKAFCKLFGYDEKEVVGMSVSKLAAPESLSLVISNITNRIETPYEAIGIKKDGSGFSGEISGKTISYKGGEARVAVIRDISAKKTAERLLIESEKKHRNLVENMPKDYFFYSHDTQGVFQFLSPTIFNILGYSQEEFKKHYTTYLTSNPINQLVNKYTELAIQGILQPPYKVEIFHINGTKRWLEVTETPVLDETGKVIGVEGLARDITEQLAAENTIRESRERLSNFMNSASDIFALYDENLNLVEVNEAGLKLINEKDKNRVLGKNISEIFPNISKTGRIEKYLEVIKTGKSIRIEDFKADYSPQEVFLVVVAFKVGSGLGVIARDVTERRKTEERLIESEKNYRQLVEQSPDGILIVKLNRVLYANKTALNIFGVDSHQELTDIFEVILPEYHQMSKVRWEMAMEGIDVPFTEIKIKKTDGSITEVESKPSKVIYLGKPAMQVALHDLSQLKQLTKERLRAEIAEETAKQLKREIEERNRVEKQLIESQKFSKRLVDSSLDMICASDTNGKIIEFNSAALKTFGYTSGEIIGKHVSVLYASGEQQVDINHLLREKDGSFRGEIINVRKNGEKFTSFLSASVLKDDTGKIFGFMGVSRDITESKNIQETIKISEERYRDLFENATDLIQSVDERGGILFVNKSWKSTLGYSEEEIEKKNIFDFIHPDCISQCQNLFTRISAGEQIKNIEIEYLTKKRKKILLNGNISARFENGKFISTRGIFRDITESRQSEELIRQSLREKEVLLKEVHHRVKNNMQVISSILNLQSAYVKDKKILEILKESQNRIKTMAYIHESLYQANDFSKIDFSEYILTLCNNLSYSYQGSGQPIIKTKSNQDIFQNTPVLETNVEKGVTLNIDRAIPSGLIINELVSNAYKHAFANQKSGLVLIKLFRVKEIIHIEISDNGSGIAENIDIKNSETLGLQLVSTLIEQLNGRIIMERKKGTKFSISFKEN